MLALWHWVRKTSVQPLSRLSQWPLVVFGIALGAILTAILTLRFAINQDIVVGKPSPRTINAPRDLTFESAILTEAKRREAANEPRNLVYVEDEQIQSQQRQRLQDTFNVITSIRDNPSLDGAERQRQISELPTIPISSTLATVLVQFSDEDWQRVINQSNALYDRTLQDHNFSIDETTLNQIKTRYLPYNIPANLTDDQRTVVRYFVEHTLEANRTLNEEETLRRQNGARAAVAPVSKSVVAGENVVRQGDLVTAEQHETLLKLGLITPSLNLAALIGRALLAGLVALALTMYIYLYQPTLRTHQRALLVILGLVVTPILIARLFIGTWLNFPETFALAMVALPLAALFDGSLALATVALIAIVISFIGDNAFQLGMISFAGAATGVFAIRRGDRAVTFVLAGAWIIGIVFCTALVWRLNRSGGTTWEGILFTLGLSIVNGSISVLMAFGIHNVLGRAAGIVTPMQLLELAHPNQPLLRRLMQEAPGTYHHSVVVSNLAEQAAERVGADPLLTRVGAYYHDVGKMLRPYFFTDNQYDRSNVHDSLDPKTSAKLIADHVVEGAKVARKYNMPQQVIDFIEQHHGTDVIKYFYQQALQSEDSANIDDYRYPGPKPQSKETAILMLADGVEATVRSREQAGQLIAEPNDDAKIPKGCQTIAQVVNQSIDSRIASGQLDESPLTLHDLQEVRRSFVKTLHGIYHPRVEYPKLIRDMQEK